VTFLPGSRRWSPPREPDHRASAPPACAAASEIMQPRRNKLEGMYDAVAGGLRTAGLVPRIEALEEEVAAP
jgi:hypothetical protein